MARSRAQAADLVRQGAVTVNGRVVTKPAEQIRAEDRLEVADGSRSPWVNRAAVKLLAALQTWPLPVAGARCLDVGASTGGFTQVLLSRGARTVVALDVGHDQLHPDVAHDPRVTNLERRSIRDQSVDTLGGSFDAIVADLSFISLRLVMPILASLVERRGEASGWLVLLVKPQFEVGRERLGKGGIVTNPADREAALRGVLRAGEESSLVGSGVMLSPITGTHGNVEYLLWLASDPSGRMDPHALDQTIRELTHAKEDP